ncbi:MAG TPA: hypothetical protein VFE88_01260 [Candidatus Nanoarchaeia archaeon]|nr:hypothetical protein [Candidatus Nanoarchaeia archaeon]
MNASDRSEKKIIYIQYSPGNSSADFHYLFEGQATAIERGKELGFYQSSGFRNEHTDAHKAAWHVLLKQGIPLETLLEAVHQPQGWIPTEQKELLKIRAQWDATPILILLSRP